jgi:hypothetical protein
MIDNDFDKIKCNYIKCYAGMGVAGRLCCFLGGDYTNENCDKFEDEKEALYNEACEYIKTQESQITALREALTAAGEYIEETERVFKNEEIDIGCAIGLLQVRASYLAAMKKVEGGNKKIKEASND